MSSRCFETEGSSSGRRLYIQVWYCVFYMHQYKQSCRWKSVFACVHSNVRSHVHMYSTIESLLPPARLLIQLHVKHTIPYPYIQPSSWRWTLGFETCSRHQQL